MVWLHILASYYTDFICFREKRDQNAKKQPSLERRWQPELQNDTISDEYSVSSYYDDELKLSPAFVALVLIQKPCHGFCSKGQLHDLKSCKN